MQRSLRGAALQRALPNTCSRPRDELLFPPMPATALRHLESSAPPPRPGPAPAPGPGARRRRLPSAPHGRALRARAGGRLPARGGRVRAGRRRGGRLPGRAGRHRGRRRRSRGGARPRRDAPPCAPAPPVTHASDTPLSRRGSGLDSAEAVAPDRDRWGSLEISTFSPAGRPAYLAHWGLAEPPFGLEPDPRFAFERADHREGLARILFGITQLGGLVVITGEIGAGQDPARADPAPHPRRRGLPGGRGGEPPAHRGGPPRGGAGGDRRRARRRLHRAPRRAPARAAGGRRGRRAAHRAGRRRGPAPRTPAPSTSCACSPTPATASRPPWSCWASPS